MAARIGDPDLNRFFTAAYLFFPLNLRASPGAKHLFFAPFFNGNIHPVRRLPVNGGERNGDIEGDAVIFSQDGFSKGSDFIGRGACPGQDAVCARDDHLDFAPLHIVSGGIIRDNMVGDSLLRQFPGRQDCSLRTGPGFVAKDVKLFALRLRFIDRRGGAADIDKSQPARIAMGENCHSVPDELCSPSTDGAAVLHIFIGENFSGPERELLFLGYRGAGRHRCQNLTHGIDRVHRRWARIGKNLEDFLNMQLEALKRVAPESTASLRQTIGGSCPDGSGSAGGHIPDGQSGLKMLQDGRIDVYSLPVLSINDLVSKANDPNIEVVAPVEGAPVYCDGAAFRKGDEALRDAFDVELAKLKESGEFAKIIEPYGFSAAAAMSTTREKLCAAQ